MSDDSNPLAHDAALARDSGAANVDPAGDAASSVDPAAHGAPDLSELPAESSPAHLDEVATEVGSDAEAAPEGENSGDSLEGSDEGESVDDVSAEDANSNDLESGDTDADSGETNSEGSDAEEVVADDGGSGIVTDGDEGDDDGDAIRMDWYILKVQSNRENSISEALQKRVAVEGLDEYFGQIFVPTEMVTEFKGGKKRVVRRKLYPGYILVEMCINDDSWFLVRETPGIGDFTGSGGKPTPMLPHEVQRIVSKQEEKTDEAPKLKINFNVGDRVKISEGTFENFEGEVSTLDEASGKVTVMINIFGRSTPVELEYWQVEVL